MSLNPLYLLAGLPGLIIGMQASAAKDAANAQKASNELQRQQQLISQSKERRTQIQQARIKQAQVLQGGVNSGVTGSSSAISGAQASLGTQLNTNLGFLNVSEDLATRATAFNNKAVDAQAKGALWANIGQLATTAASAGLAA